MARDNPLHDNPRSKETGEKREAKKGDTQEIDGEEHESMGYMRQRKGTYKEGEKVKDEDLEGDLSPAAQRGITGSAGDKAITAPDPDAEHGIRTEFWRPKRKKKEERPMS